MQSLVELCQIWFSKINVSGTWQLLFILAFLVVAIIMIKDIELFANKIQSLAILAKAEYEPVVNDILRKKIIDEQYILHTLDKLLDFCFNDEILLLYKKLCRYYYPLNRDAIADYIRYYFEMYEPERLSNCLKQENK